MYDAASILISEPCRRCERTGSRACGELRTATEQCRHRARAASDHDHLDIEPVLFKNFEIFGDPDRALKTCMSAVVGHEAIGRVTVLSCQTQTNKNQSYL